MRFTRTPFTSEYTRYEINDREVSAAVWHEQFEKQFGRQHNQRKEDTLEDKQNDSNIDAALRAGQKIGELQTAGTVIYPTRMTDDWKQEPAGVPFLMKRQGYEVSSVESMLDAPVMARSTVTLHDADSFVRYVNLYKDDASVVFADLTSKKFEAVIDYHEKDGARWGKHRVVFSPVETPDFKLWKANNGQQKAQIAFARFVEENIPTIGTPDGATLLEMCLTLEQKSTVQFRSAIRLQDGQHQLKYEEELDGKAGTKPGSMKIPDVFSVVVSVYQGVEAKAIDARFRYRIADGICAMWYELVRLDDYVSAAFDEIEKAVKAGVGSTSVVCGVAPTIS